MHRQPAAVRHRAVLPVADERDHRRRLQQCGAVLINAFMDSMCRRLQHFVWNTLATNEALLHVASIIALRLQGYSSSSSTRVWPWWTSSSNCICALPGHLPSDAV